MTNPAVSRTCDFCSDFSSIDKTTNTESIKNLPLEDRPREKLFLRGVEALTDAELLAILLRTGTAKKSALEIAKGMGQAKAATVLAALEIGRRIASARPLDKIHFGCPQDGAAFLMPRLRYATKEQFLVILLNSKNKVIGTELVSEGSLTNSVVHPREVFLPAILQHAASICVAHNHPSGDPMPSIEDRQLTAVLLAAGQTLGIPLLDHLIIGDGAYYSFQEDGALEV